MGSHADATMGTSRRALDRGRPREREVATEAATSTGKGSRRATPYAAAYADLLPESHREALRDAAVTYLDECFSAITDGEAGQS